MRMNAPKPVPDRLAYADVGRRLAQRLRSERLTVLLQPASADGAGFDLRQDLWPLLGRRADDLPPRRPGTLAFVPLPDRRAASIARPARRRELAVLCDRWLDAPGPLAGLLHALQQALPGPPAEHASPRPLAVWLDGWQRQFEARCLVVLDRVDVLLRAPVQAPAAALFDAVAESLGEPLDSHWLLVLRDPASMTALRRQWAGLGDEQLRLSTWVLQRAGTTLASPERPPAPAPGGALPSSRARGPRGHGLRETLKGLLKQRK